VVQCAFSCKAWVGFRLHRGVYRTWASLGHVQRPNLAVPIVICSDTWGLVQVIKAGKSRKHRSRGTCVPSIIALSMLCKVGHVVGQLCFGCMGWESAPLTSAHTYASLLACSNQKSAQPVFMLIVLSLYEVEVFVTSGSCLGFGPL